MDTAVIAPSWRRLDVKLKRALRSGFPAASLLRKRSVAAALKSGSATLPNRGGRGKTRFRVPAGFGLRQLLGWCRWAEFPVARASLLALRFGATAFPAPPAPSPPLPWPPRI